MSYAGDAARVGRIPFTVVKLGFDTTITPTGSEYICAGDAPLGQHFHPCVNSVAVSPTRITDSGLGYRGSITITCQDFKMPGSSGTYFGKLLGANRFWLDRPIEVYRGFQQPSFSLANMKKSLYFLKKIEGPDEKGVVRLVASDILTVLDGDRASIPAPTNGNLAAAITNTATGSINIGDNSGFELVLAPTGYAIIDSEIVSYNALTSTTHITLSGRGLFGTTAVAHSINAPVRVIVATDSMNVVDLISFLIAGAGIDAAYINTAEWNAERDAYLASENVQLVITKPTPIKTIVSDLAVQTMCAVWFDEESQLIKIKSIGPTLSPTKSINHVDHILDSGHKITRDQSKAVTQVWVYFDKINKAEGDDEENFRSVYIHVDTDLEGASGYNASRVEKIYAPFLPDSGVATASKIATRMIAQRGDGATQCTFKLDVRDATLDVGDTVTISTDLWQGSDGEPAQKNWMIIERNRKESHVEYLAVATGLEPGTRYASVGANTLPNYTAATADQKSKYAFISNDSGLMSNGDAAYKIL